MKDVKDLIPWKVTDISFRPFDGFWSFNPSIHFDGQTWRCVLRCADYAMPGGVTIRSKNSMSGQQTKNAMVVFDPQTWKPIHIYKMHEKDGLPRASTPHVGYEDMRLFKTSTGGLQGIAASLHLRREREVRASDSRPQHQSPEQVVVSFDAEYNIVGAHPVRGDGWSGPQKNWAPFDRCVEPRFLYSIGKGTLFGDRGPLSGDENRVSPEEREMIASGETPVAIPNLHEAAVAAPSDAPSVVPPKEVKKHSKKSGGKPLMLRGTDVRMVRGGRVKLDSKPSTRPVASRTPTPLARDGSMRVVSTAGRALAPKYNGLRGGTQLVHVGEDAWLGVGHEMKFVDGKKYYWHVFYLVNSRGKMTRASDPMKIAPNTIEFAAGMAIDGDRVVVSFGVDDMQSKLGETSLSAVMERLRPVS